MPDTLDAFMSQRYRWVYGAMQIMKHHAGAIFLGRHKLSWAQRYQFLVGWLPWISDGLGMIVTYMALIWTGIDVGCAAATFDVPMPTLVGRGAGAVLRQDHEDVAALSAESALRM